MLGGGLTLQMGHIFGGRRFDLDRLALARANITGRDFAALDPRGTSSVRMAGKKPSRLLVILRRRWRALVSLGSQHSESSETE